jgi:crossover junction endodeoxyribonuclease RusA
MTKRKKEIDDDLNRDKPKYPNQYVSFSIGITPSVNHMYIGKTKNLTTSAKRYIKETQDTCLSALKKAGWKRDNPYVWYYMDLYFYMPDKRIRDSHNCIKLMMDTLEGTFNSNDYYVMPRIQHVTLDRDNPRIEVCIFPQEVM